MEEQGNKLWNVSGDFIKHNGIYSPLMNPGNVSSLHEKPQRILAAFFTEGFEFHYGRNYGQNKGVLFSWILSQTSPSCCRIGGVYSRQSKDNVLVSGFLINRQVVDKVFGWMNYCKVTS